MIKNQSFERVIGLSLVVLILLVVIIGPSMCAYNPNDINLESKNESPSSQYLLGTDHLGRCIFTRLIHGARYSIGTSFVALTLTFAFSLIYGFISAYVGGVTDTIMTGFSDLAMAFPPMVVVLSLTGIFSSSVGGLVLAVVIASWPWYAKIVRSLVLVEKKKAYVSAARMCGSGHLKILMIHILPNVLNAVVVMYFTGISNMILMISGFSYLGVGFDQEIPEWGNMLSNAKSYIFTKPERLILPGLCIFITSVGFNLLGESIRHRES